MEVRIEGDTGPLGDSLEIMLKIVDWACLHLKLQAKSVDVILVDDKTLRELHKIYLDEDTFTDVMTFNLGEDTEIEGEIYISIDRATEQAGEFGIAIEEELARLMIHGCLHLAGYDDQTETDQQKMKRIEDKYVREVCTKYLIKN